jgi:hypothetical protein
MTSVKPMLTDSTNFLVKMNTMTIVTSVANALQLNAFVMLLL